VSAAFTRKLRRRVLGAIVAVLAIPAAASAATPATPEQLDAAGVHEIVVKRAPGLDKGDRARVRAGADVTLEAALRLPDTEVVRAAPGHLAEALAALRAEPGVVYAEANVPVHAFTADAYWGQQWGRCRTSARRRPFAAGCPAPSAPTSALRRRGRSATPEPAR